MKNCIMAMVVTVSVGLGGTAAYAASGTDDMWNGQMKKDNLFSPHVNTCDSTEVFIPMGDPAQSLGFCIEKDQRPEDEYEDARQTCVALGKRLPEPTEFKFACILAPAGLNDMTDSWEWASNRLTHYPLNGGLLIGAYIAGNENCTWGAMNALSGNWNSSSSIQDHVQPFRCVR